MTDGINIEPTVRALIERIQRELREMRGPMLWESSRLNEILTYATTVTNFEGIHTRTQSIHVSSQADQ